MRVLALGDAHAKIGDWELVLELPSELMGMSVFVGRKHGPRSFGRLGVVLAVPREPADDAAMPRALRHATAVSHPCLLAVVDMDVTEAAKYVVYDYVEGIDLATLSSRGPVPPSIVVSILRDAARGLHAIHSAAAAGSQQTPLVHGVLSAGFVVVGADGHARLTAYASGTLLEPSAVRMRRCAAPEVKAGQAADALSDIYALGAVMLGALLGRPFADDSTELAATLFSGERTEKSSALAGAVARATARLPEQRFASADALLAALERFEAASPREVAQFVAEVAGADIESRRNACVAWTNERKKVLGEPEPRRRSRFRLSRRQRRLMRPALVLVLVFVGALLGLFAWSIQPS